MESEHRTLVILDTNKIRANIDWEKDYSNFQPKGDLVKIINWIEGNNLQDLVYVGLPEVVVEEFVTNRCENFGQELKNLNSSLDKLKNMSCFDFSRIIFPPDGFDYRTFIKNKIKEYVETKPFISILKLNRSHYSQSFESILKKAIKKEKPFTDAGKGFKDAVIWQIILNLNIRKYSNIFLLSENQKDFGCDLKIEFEKKFSKSLNLEPDTNMLIVSLEKIYNLYVNYRQVLSYLKTDYFKSKLIEYLVELFGLSIDNFSVKSIVGINEALSKDLEEFELSNTYTEEDLPGLKRVDLLFENSGREFNAWLIIEPETNEIIALNYQETK